MKRFAKLFERDGHQVLVCYDQDAPGIVITFRDDEAELYISPRVTFDPKGPSDEAEERAWALADKVFDKANEEWAFDIRSKTLANLNISQ